MKNSSHSGHKGHNGVVRVLVKRRLCGCGKHFCRKGQRNCRWCHAEENREHRKKMVSVPRDLLPVELWTARGRKALRRLGTRVVVRLERREENVERPTSNVQRRMEEMGR